MPKKQSIKNQIRNINRFLRKKGADLDEATKQDQQRKIEALERQIAGKVVKKKEQKSSKDPFDVEIHDYFRTLPNSMVTLVDCPCGA